MSAALATALFACYLGFAPPVSGDKDASELTLALATGGVIHPTGYPLYTILGHAFVGILHRLGASFPFAANAWAALGGGVAMFFYHRLALRLVPARRGGSRLEAIVLASLPVLLLGFDPVWLVECTVVEVNSWQLAWAFGTALVFTGLIERLQAKGAATPALMRRIAAWGLLCGLGLAHHATAVFMAGALTLALGLSLVRARRFARWVPWAWLAGGLIPLLGLGYIYARALHPHGQVWPMLGPSFQSALDHVTARAYRVYLGHWAPDGAQAAWLRWYIHPYLWPGLAILAFSALRSLDPLRRTVALSLLAAAVAQTLFAFQYGVGDPDAYFLPGLAVALLAVPAAGGGAWAALKRSRPASVATAAAVAVAVILFVGQAVYVAGGRKRLLIQADEAYHAAWTSIPYEAGIVLWPDDKYSRLKEYQVFRGEKPGLDVYATAVLLNPYPRERFQQRYGFDPLGDLDEAHRLEPLKPEFVIGQQATATDAHAYAVIHETITRKSGLPVIAFDPPNPPRLLSPAPAGAARPDSAAAPR